MDEWTYQRKTQSDFTLLNKVGAQFFLHEH